MMVNQGASVKEHVLVNVEEVWMIQGLVLPRETSRTKV